MTGYAPEASDPAPSGDQFDQKPENTFVSTAENPVSSFSVDADGASYAYMRRCVQVGMNVPSYSVRIEEYLNYFTFDYPEPADGKPWASMPKSAPAPGHRRTSSCAWV